MEGFKNLSTEGRQCSSFCMGDNEKISTRWCVELHGHRSKRWKTNPSSVSAEEGVVMSNVSSFSFLIFVVEFSLQQLRQLVDGSAGPGSVQRARSVENSTVAQVQRGINNVCRSGHARWK